MSLTERLYLQIAPQAEDEAIGVAEPRNFLIHVASLAASKVADGLIDPKLVLAWLMNALGAPAYLIGVLVPIREAGALLPQLALAGWVQRSRRKKWFWAVGAALEGAAAAGIALVALSLDSAAAGWAIVALLAMLALARGVCSVSYKDALARTVVKRTRGTAQGSAGAISSVAVMGFGIALAIGVIPLSASAVAMAIGVAGLLWLGASALFLRLAEPPREAAAEEAPDLGDLFEPFWRDPQLRRFVGVRGLLTATALAPPYIVTLASGVDQEGRLGELGPLVIASGAAAIVSSYVWGRLSDRSSRRTLAYAGAAAAVVLGTVAAIGWVTGSIQGTIGAAASIFAAQIAYQGVRSGRKTHLTDMATDADRARYTALSNTAIGIILLVTGVFGLIAQQAGVAVVLALFAGMSAAGAVLALGLDEVQKRG